MRDAEAAINAGALWLGTLGYLVTVEQVGHCVRLKGATNRSEKKYRAIFTAACADFGDTAVEKNERNLLYDVRCALAHEFSLSSQKNQFIYSRGLKLLQGAAPRPITVCLDAVWKYVNDLVDQLRTEHDNGNVTLVNTMTPQGLLTMRFEIRP
jgi:hypothetical protein